jgi:hypothetical protein
MELNTKRIVTVLSALAALDLAIGTGQLKITSHMIPEGYIPAVQDWASFLGTILSTATAIITGGSLASNASPAAPQASPPKPLAAIMLLIGASLMLGLLSTGDAFAQQKPVSPLIRAPQITGSFLDDIKANNAALAAQIKGQLAPLPDIQSKLDAIKAGLPPLKTPGQVHDDIETAVSAIEAVTVKDLQDGIAVFDAAKNYAGSNCFKALLDVVQANVTANASIAAAAKNEAPPTGSDPVGDKEKALPVQHAFLVIAKIYNIIVANHPGGPISLQCAAMKQDINSSSPMSALLGSSVFSKALPILKIIGIGL